MAREVASRTRLGATGLLRLAGALAIIAAITLLCFRLIPVNATTAGFAYLVAILVIATAWGLLESTVASLAAVLSFNYFFLPPIGTFTIADPQNWVALLAFLATSIIASHLSARAKRRTKEALDRQQEMERLYALSRAILLTEANKTAPKQFAHQIAQVFDFSSVALYERETSELHRAGPADLPAVEDQLREAALQGTFFHDQLSRTTVTSIRLGGQPIGSLALQGHTLSDGALQALANLVAIGLEKVRSQEAASRAEAARQSEALKSTLLDAIAHEFKTPLTSIKAAASALLAESLPKAEERRELVSIVNEEADRLSRLVTEAIQMARIEGGAIQLHKNLERADELVRAALEQMSALAEGRTIHAQISENLPRVELDRDLLGLALRLVLDNALKYSPPGSPVAVGARTWEHDLVITVTDEGPGISEQAQSRIFEKFYRGPNTRAQVPGTGMGLAIAREIVRAHGGEISFKSSLGKGSEFSISVPLVALERPA